LEFDKAGWNKDHFCVGADSVPIPTSEDINEFMFPRLEEAHEKKLFIFVWSLDTHDPYFHRDAKRTPFCPSKEIWLYKEVKQIRNGKESVHLKAMYEDMVYYNDYHIGILIAKLKEMNLFDETFFILTSDHGEAFGEHGFGSHGREPFDELLRVPLLMKFPQSEFRGRVSGLVQHIDIVPTIFDYVGLTRTNKAEQGRSLLPLLKGRTEINSFIFAEHQLAEKLPRYFVLRTHDYKYVELKRGRFGLGQWLREKNGLWPLSWFIFKPRWLFCLGKDPEEKINIIGQERKRADEFHKLLKMILKDNRKRSRGLIDKKRGKAEIDPEVVQQLRALGYFD
jgi:arylsulfatase A-like enzyme